MIIGTAGHVDHGKTALVKALTGVDTDRLKEEKARGISIDLGFAFRPTACGGTLGFVDVPGHEGFVHTMVAGASGIDFALLVVAADDGVMPQTLEHLAILDFLGVERGVVAITKSDLVSEQRLQEVSAEVRDVVRQMPLTSAPIIPVSVISGRGIDALLKQLEEAAGESSFRPADARFRLAIDRAFTLQGIGLVATGTVLSGCVRVDEQLRLSPSGLSVRVRSVHAQNRAVESARAGDRCALNLVGQGLSKQTIRRGDMLLDPELHAPTDRIDAQLRILRTEAKLLRQWFPIRLHHGAAEVGAHIVWLEDESDQGGAVQLVLDRSIAAGVPDPFVIRDVSARHTLGGGRFVDLRPPARRRRTPERKAQRLVMAMPNPQASFKALLDTAPYAWDLTIFARDRALSVSRVAELVRVLQPVLLEAGKSRIALSAQRWRDWCTSLVAALTAFHGENPDRQGIGYEQLRWSLRPRLSSAAFAAALEREELAERVTRESGFVRLSSHTAQLKAEDETTWRRIEPLLAGGARFRPPRVRDIAALLGRPEEDVRRLLKLAGRLGRVDQVAHDHFFLRSTVSEMLDIARNVARESPDGAFTAAQVRDRLSNGRKVAIQILEFFDGLGITRHRGDQRRFRPDSLNTFDTAKVALGRDSFPVGRSDFKSE